MKDDNSDSARSRPLYYEILVTTENIFSTDYKLKYPVSSAQVGIKKNIATNPSCSIAYRVMVEYRLQTCAVDFSGSLSSVEPPDSVTITFLIHRYLFTNPVHNSSTFRKFVFYRNSVE